MMKTKLALLLLISLCFAASGIMEASALAIMISAIILILLFMIGRGFNIQSLEITAKDEFYQLIIAIVLLGCFFIASSSIDGIVGGKGLHGETADILNNSLSNFSSILKDIHALEKVNVEGSKYDSCQFFSAYFTTSSCGGYSVIAQPVNTAHSIISIVYIEYSSLYTIAQLGSGVLMTIIFPLGLFFYSFKFTKPVGSVLIAIAVSFYIIFPLMVILTEEVAKKTGVDKISATQPQVKDCDPKESITTNANNAREIFKGMEGYLGSTIEYALVRGLLFPIVYLLAITSTIRSVSGLAGVEIDVSAISRLM